MSVGMMNYKWLLWILCLLVAGGIHSGKNQVQAGEAGSQIDPKSKINFNLGKLNNQGLYGPPGGLRALDYEFCIPADPAFEAQVKAIDQTIAIFAGSRGRVGCAQGEKLCIGNTHQPEFKTVLLRLASLPYIKQIKQCFFE
jgi:hypothetical protein